MMSTITPGFKKQIDDTTPLLYLYNRRHKYVSHQITGRNRKKA